LQKNHNIGFALKNGESWALDLLFKKHYNDLCRYAYKYVQDQDEIEEIVQHCFVKLWENREKAESIILFKPYLYRSVQNACINKLQHEKVKAEYRSAAAYELKMLYTSESDSLQQAELADAIRKEVEKLPKKNREVFKLRFFNGLNTKEVCDKLGVNERTVESHVRNAFKMLRKNLKHFLTIFFIFFTNFFTYLYK